MRGSLPEKRDGPFAAVSVKRITFMPFAGGFHGPPELDHPEQLGMQISRPRRFASLWAWANMSNQSSELNFSGPGGMAHPASNIWTPPMPALASASKSQVMPFFVTLPFIMWYHVCGFADAGGALKPSSSVRAPSGRAHASVVAAARVSVLQFMVSSFAYVLGKSLAARSGIAVGL